MLWFLSVFLLFFFFLLFSFFLGHRKSLNKWRISKMPDVFIAHVSLWSFRGESGEALKLLLEKGFDPNVQHRGSKNTPLHLAVKRKNETAVRILAQCPECDVNLQVRWFLGRRKQTYDAFSTVPPNSGNIACDIRRMS